MKGVWRRGGGVGDIHIGFWYMKWKKKLRRNKAEEGITNKQKFVEREFRDFDESGRKAFLLQQKIQNKKWKERLTSTTSKID